MAARAKLLEIRKQIKALERVVEELQGPSVPGSDKQDAA